MAPALSLVVDMCILLTSTTLAVNIAFDKPPSQIGVYGGAKDGLGATADKAVDGRYDRDTGDDYLSVCACPDTVWHGRGPVKWWVDLEDTYSITTVTVYNTYNTEVYRRLSNFTVEVLTSDNKTIHSCGVFSGLEPVNRGDSYRFDCYNKQGRYVFVRKLSDSPRQQLIVLCEVIVDGFLGADTTTTTATTTTTTTTTTMSSLPPSQRPNTNASEAKNQTSKPANEPATSTTSKPGDTGNESQYLNKDKSKTFINTSTLPWTLFALSCVVIIIMAILLLYYLRVKPLHHVTKPANQSESMTRTTSSYINSSEDTSRDQQVVNTSNTEYVGYENVDVRNFNHVDNQRENQKQSGQYESLHGQVSNDNANTPYETIH